VLTTSELSAGLKEHSAQLCKTEQLVRESPYRLEQNRKPFPVFKEPRDCLFAPRDSGVRKSAVIGEPDILRFPASGGVCQTYDRRPKYHFFFTDCLSRFNSI
jgi:hypothetical protein